MHEANILVVEDEAVQRACLQHTLASEGYSVLTVEGAEAALEVLASIRPDLLLVDVRLPKMDGFELCHRLKGHDATRLIPLVLVTGLTATEDRIRGLEAGADDFLAKPVEVAALLARVRSLLRLKRHTDQLDHAEAVLFCLARGVEARHPALQEHCARLAHYAVALGQALGLEAEAMQALRRGAVLHDIGKIGIPDAILFKPGPLTPDEWAVMREHPVIGERMCQPLRSLRDVLPIIRHHHESWDGTGYPDGLAGSTIPLTARILQVADIFDNLTSVGPYRTARTAAEAIDILRREAAQGRRDPKLVDLFRRLWEAGGLRASDAGSPGFPGVAPRRTQGPLSRPPGDGAFPALLAEVVPVDAPAGGAGAGPGGAASGGVAGSRGRRRRARPPRRAARARASGNTVTSRTGTARRGGRQSQRIPMLQRRADDGHP